MSDPISDLTVDEINLLISECDGEIDKIKRELGYLLIKQDMLRRKKHQWQEEKDYLEILKNGVDFNEFLVAVPNKTMKTIKGHYDKVMKRYNKMFPNDTV